MTDRERYLNQFYGRYKAGAKARGIPFELTKDEFGKLWKKSCWYCAAKIWPIGIDRVDSLQGYRADNIVACCTECNRMKSNLTAEEFLARCKRITQYNSLNNL